MSSVSPTGSGPFPLYHVLEAEYVALHGPLPKDYDQSEADPEKRLTAILAMIHTQKPSALCISGGGIRSATFALGVLQGLARPGLLPKFDYLSTVSGGGYIGSWLSSWAHRDPGGLDAVAKSLASQPQKKLDPEPVALEHLREYSNYLSPKVGLVSADTWTLVATVLRNMILNWLVLIPLLAAALMVPRFYAVILRGLEEHGSPAVTIALLIGSAVLGAISISYIGLNRPSGANRNETQAKYLVTCLAPLVASAVALTLFWALHHKNSTVPEHWYWFFVFGEAVNLLGYVFWTLTSRKSGTKQKIYELGAVLLTGAVTGWLFWITKNLFFHHLGPRVEYYICFAVPVVLAIFQLSAYFLVGIISLWTDDDDREWWSRSDAWVLIAGVGWAAASALVVFGPWALAGLWHRAKAALISIGGVSGFVSWLFGRSGSTPANKEQKKRAGLSSIIMDNALMVASAVSVVLLLALLSLGATALIKILAGDESGPGILRAVIDYRLGDDVFPDDPFDHLTVIYLTPLWLVALLTAVLAAISAITAKFVNINRFSLHAMYRNRLIRAYLGASNPARNPNKFTGFDPRDNFPVHYLRNSGKPIQKPFHVINMTLNLVAGEKLAWQQRKAESFTVSPLHAGCYRQDVGYRDSAEYGGADGISLGTSVAISGAAASPNMGYHSSPMVGILMTLFNARLGWWLGNPGAAGDSTYRLDGPFFALKPIVSEMLGLTNDRSKYIYLSDGGHFENLGLYEMVLRRCHYIVVSDGSQDGKCQFQDLGGAIRKIRIDFGIPIEFQGATQIFPRCDDQAQNDKGKYCAIGKIRYSCVDKDAPDGTLIYIKPAFYGDEPRDIYEYARSSEDFPHETTADQWFSESQFESYRMLGSHIMNEICGENWVATSMEDFKGKVEEYLARQKFLAKGAF